MQTRSLWNQPPSGRRTINAFRCPSGGKLQRFIYLCFFFLIAAALFAVGLHVDLCQSYGDGAEQGKQKVFVFVVGGGGGEEERRDGGLSFWM